MGFTAKHTVHHNGVQSDALKPVKFTDDEVAAFRADETGPIADLLARGAIEGELDKSPATKAAGKAAEASLAVDAQQNGDTSEKSLTAMSPMQLGAIAKKLGIPKEPKLAGEELIKAIEAKRAEIAEQSDKIA